MSHLSRFIGVFAMVAAVGATGCGTMQLPRLNIYEVKKDPESPPTYAGMPLKSGQVILTESPEATSFGFMLMPDQFYNFTHGGVVVMEEGEAWVYEIAAEIVTFPFHERVLDNVQGRVARRRLFEYVMPNLYAEVIDLPPGVDGAKVADFVRDHHRKKTEFDAYFRWNEHDKLFCTEFVELSQRAGGAPPREPGPARDHPALNVVKQWLGVPMNEALPAAYYYDPKRVVASMGQFGTRAAAYAYFEGKRELYRRFKKDQRAGYVFKLRGTGNIELRDDVTRFIVGVAHLYDGVQDPPPWGDPRTTRIVRKYADAYFGPVPD